MEINLKKIKQEKSIKELIEFGILNLDKPSGPTSFKTDEIVKKMLGLRKMSHFGTLDPKVTGVLPVALNRACKLTKWFMSKNKEYVGVMKIHKKIDKTKLKQEMKKFLGRIKQKPPVKSRVKRQVRERKVYSWKLIEYNQDEGNALFKTKVEAGTYIRKLISDMGKNIGGSHMLELRRTKASIFSEDDENFINLYDLGKAVKEYKEGKEKKLREIIIPGEVISKIMPVVKVKKRSEKRLLTGKPVMKKDVKERAGELEEGENFAVFSKNRFIEIARRVNKENIIAKPEFVFN